MTDDDDEPLRNIMCYSSNHQFCDQGGHLHFSHHGPPPRTFVYSPPRRFHSKQAAAGGGWRTNIIIRQPMICAVDGGDGEMEVKFAIHASPVVSYNHMNSLTHLVGIGDR